jgi:hypothetical protein
MRVRAGRAVCTASPSWSPRRGGSVPASATWADAAQRQGEALGFPVENRTEAELRAVPSNSWAGLARSAGAAGEGNAVRVGALFSHADPGESSPTARTTWPAPSPREASSPATGSPPCASNSSAMLEMHHGVPWAGAVLVLLNVRLSAEELECIVRHRGARFLIDDEQLGGTSAEVASAVGIGDVRGRGVVRRRGAHPDREHHYRWRTAALLEAIGRKRGENRAGEAGALCASLCATGRPGVFRAVRDRRKDGTDLRFRTEVNDREPGPGGLSIAGLRVDSYRAWRSAEHGDQFAQRGRLLVLCRRHQAARVPPGLTAPASSAPVRGHAQEGMTPGMMDTATASPVHAEEGGGESTR